MCHGEEWEMLKLAYAQEVARRNREKAEAESRKSATTAPPKPADAPVKDEEPVPV
jgi:hypothetical protein